MRASIVLAVIVVLACVLTVSAQNRGGGECRNPRGVWECPEYFYELERGFEVRNYTHFEVVFHAREGRDILRTTDLAEIPLWRYLDGNNSGGVMLNHTIPFVSEVIRGLTTHEIAAARFIPRRSVPGPAPTEVNVTLHDVPAGYHVAVAEFFGDINDEVIYTHLERLARAVNASGRHYDDRAFTFATYSPPEIGGAERRNEVWVHLIPANATSTPVGKYAAW